MKKAYIIFTIAAATLFGAYALNACSGQGNTALAADEQPVDLNAPPVANNVSSHGNSIPVDEFDKLIKGNKLTMVDFYTVWCGPCKQMAPHVQRLKKDKSNEVNVLQIDAEAQANIANRYGVRAYPTIVFFKKGQVIENLVGYKSFEELLDVVTKLK